MDIAVRELWQNGGFAAALHPEPPLFDVFWAALAVGAVIQWLLGMGLSCLSHGCLKRRSP